MGRWGRDRGIRGEGDDGILSNRAKRARRGAK